MRCTPLQFDDEAGVEIAAPPRDPQTGPFTPVETYDGQALPKRS